MNLQQLCFFFPAIRPLKNFQARFYLTFYLKLCKEAWPFIIIVQPFWLVCKNVCWLATVMRVAVWQFEVQILKMVGLLVLLVSVCFR